MIGLALAMIMRIILLLFLTWIVRLTEPLFTLFDHEFSGRDLILIGGGFFLVAKATWEIHGRMEGDDHVRDAGKKVSFSGVIIQIMLLDIIFSLDSVITAVGMVDEVAVMIAAVVGTALIMINHGDHIEKEPACTNFWAKASLCYLVPFLVSMASVWLAVRGRQRRRRRD